MIAIEDHSNGGFTSAVAAAPLSTKVAGRLVRSCAVDDHLRFAQAGEGENLYQTAPLRFEIAAVGSALGSVPGLDVEHVIAIRFRRGAPAKCRGN